MPSRDASAPSCWKLPMDVELEPVLVWCTETRSVNRLLVTIRFAADAKGRRDEPSKAMLRSIESLFSDRILKSRLAREWPGTRLIGHEGAIVVIDFGSALIGPMLRAGRRLQDWTERNSPPLPEDLCLYRQGDEWPALVSVTHEADAWLIGDTPPAIEGAVPCPLDADYLGIPTGQEDFLVGARPWVPGSLPTDAQSPARPSGAGRRRGK